MKTYTLVLTPTEEACGVTLEQCADVLAQGAFFASGELWAMPGNTPPALAGAVARCAFGGPVEFSHINRQTGYVVYRAASAVRGFELGAL